MKANKTLFSVRIFYRIYRRKFFDKYSHFTRQTIKTIKTERHGKYSKHCVDTWMTSTIFRGRLIRIFYFPAPWTIQRLCGMLKKASTKPFWMITKDSSKALHGIQKINIWQQFQPIDTFEYSMRKHTKLVEEWRKHCILLTTNRRCTIKWLVCSTMTHCRHSFAV